MSTELIYYIFILYIIIVIYQLMLIQTMINNMIQTIPFFLDLFKVSFAYEHLLHLSVIEHLMHWFLPLSLWLQGVGNIRPH